jgi:quinol monooxygenase YgiN
MSRKKRKSFGVMARIRGLPEKTDELRQRLLELVRLTRDENGCLSCDMIENGCDPTEFTLLEEWRDEETHATHLGASHIRKALKFLPDLLSGDLDRRKHVLRLNAVRYGTNSYSFVM